MRAVTLAGRDAAVAAPKLARMLGDERLHGEALKALRAMDSPCS